MKTINRIFLFGDSFVEGQGTYETIAENGEFLEPNLPIEELRIWRKNNSWNKFIKDRTGCEVLNYGTQGSDNYLQFKYLNDVLLNVNKHDLIIFGFTSKLRDSRCVNFAFNHSNLGSSILHKHNPLGNQIAWEKRLVEIDKFCTDLQGHAFYNNEEEKKFTKEFVEDFFVSIYNQQVYESIAQTNYLFYQNWCKKYNVNILFFDIFEKYIDENFVKNTYEVDTNVYISYKSKSFCDILTEYEIKNVKENDIGIWEWNYKRPDLNNTVIHANQHGYKVFVDYMFDNYLDTHYRFKKNI